MAEGVGAGFAPAHAGAFQAAGDDTYAGGLDAARADLPAMSHVFRGVGAVQVMAEVTGQFAVGLDQDGGSRC